MKTKDQILKERSIGITCGEILLDYSDAKEAMDEYAKQQAIAFDIYKRENHYILEHARNQYMKFGAAYVHEPRLSPDQLYAQFLESLNQK